MAPQTPSIPSIGSPGAIGPDRYFGFADQAFEKDDFRKAARLYLCGAFTPGPERARRECALGYAASVHRLYGQHPSNFGVEAFVAFAAEDRDLLIPDVLDRGQGDTPAVAAIRACNASEAIRLGAVRDEFTDALRNHVRGLELVEGRRPGPAERGGPDNFSLG